MTTPDPMQALREAERDVQAAGDKLVKLSQERRDKLEAVSEEYRTQIDAARNEYYAALLLEAAARQAVQEHQP